MDSLSAQRRSEVPDPYELERLAEELELREKSRSAGLANGDHTSDDNDDDGDFPNLPAYVPLSHDNPYLNIADFDVEKFLLSRSYTYGNILAALKEELVKLINDDYEAFISLSTDLRDEGSRLDQLKRPLDGIRGRILESKAELSAIQNNIQEKLKKRARLREEKALLQLLLKISDSITRLEKLLAIGTPEEDPTDSFELSLQKLGPPTDETPDEKLPTNRAKHLARVATEYTQLLYHVSKARDENCVFVNGVQWRVDRIQSTLSSDLDSLLTSTLTHLTEGKSENRTTELERTKWVADLTECLRTYDLLGLWRDAEDIIRRLVVRKFVKKTIYPGALGAPHSPITPYTPFTAFIPKQNAAFPSLGGSKKHQPYLLDDTNDSLARLYNQVLRFVERDVYYIMEATDNIRNKSNNPIVGKESVDKQDPYSPSVNEKGFSILGNVVWEELSRAIQDEIGGIVFAAGRPDEFRKHYETTQVFIRSLELLAPSLQAVTSFSIFEKRWQLPVYFQLRWKEIVGKLEESLARSKLEVSHSKDIQPFTTHQASAVWIAISACWSSQVFIPELCPRFWKLTLQILSRYRTWLSSCLDVIDSRTADQKNAATSSLRRPGTPVIRWCGCFARQFAAIVDVLAMDSAVHTLWDQEISLILPDGGESEDTRPKDALDAALARLTDTIPALSTWIIAILTRRCSDALVPVKSIPAQLRAMSSKRMPSEASHFVAGVLRPLKQYFGIGAGDGSGAQLKKRFLSDFSTDVFNAVTTKYINYLSGMKKTEESLKRLKKGKKPAFSLFGGSSNANDENKDEERIRAQMILDVEAFGKDARGLGVDVEHNSHFKALKEVVYANDTE
ncbi:hypothetical protein DFP72DRAFT_874343 [Ephemerocybe angulata]|uniref:Conserved oligomeric Golgi complex subunit 2 n=1 Tax=Ephemerocybe angulata TaxID=980116 RepID=A0A8H6IEP9_9AGAR|nr:hypothetical protein DFP72DRAFT_874343 [Tulosesus angulatus]